MNDYMEFSNVELYVVKNGERLPEQIDVNGPNVSCNFEIKASDEDEIEVILAGVDSYGFRHERRIYGENLEYDAYEGLWERIYDSNGNLMNGDWETEEY